MIAFHVLLTLFIYMPFHFFEEAMGNFPDWMSKHWTPTKLTYGHWMANNNFLFYPILVVCFLIFYFNQESLAVIGGAVLIWGVVNFGDHAFYTIKDRKISPGIFTGAINCVNSIWGLSLLIPKEKSIIFIVTSIIIGVVIFLTPCLLSKHIGKYFMKKFGNVA